MTQNGAAFRCLLMTDFAEDLFQKHNIPVQIEYGGWINGRVAYTEQQMIHHINRSQINLAIIEVDEIRRQVIAACPSLRIIASMRANPVNVDLEAAQENNVTVLFTPGRNAQAVAELTLGLILDLLRHVSASHDHMARGQWGEKENDPYLLFRGLELQGKTIGFLGFGEVGQATARLLQGFNASLLVYDPYQPETLLKDYHATPTDLQTLFRTSDIITLHASLNSKTRGMVGANLLHTMKPNSVLVNTARAGLVDREALFQALSSGWLAAAALDVHYDEPPSPGDPLLSLPNVLATPHIGGATREVITRGSEMVITDLARLLNGEKPFHAATRP